MPPNTPLKDTSPEDVPFRVIDPELIPSKRYYDEKFFELERERLWPKVWQMACRLEEIPEIGDWVEYRNLDKSVIVTRTKDGVKAFNNACRHRGVQLVSGRGNSGAQGFICPFHGWRFAPDGRNTFVYSREIFSEEKLTPDEIDLVPVRVEEWAGCAFINFDENAVPLLESLGPVVQRLNARNVDQLKVDWWESAVLPVNWKLAMEAFMEGYHVMRTHPQLHLLAAPGMGWASDNVGPSGPRGSKARVKSAQDYARNTIRYLARLHAGMAGMVDAYEVDVAETLHDMELPENDFEAMAQTFYGRLNHEITEMGKKRGLPMFDLNQVAMEQEFNAVEFMFPHFFLLPMFSSMSSYRIRPLTPETCLFEIWALKLCPEGEERPVPTAPTPRAHDDPGFPEIPRQDYSNLPLQQLGLHAGGFDHMILSKQYEGLISNYQRLIDGYLGGTEPEQLAKAAHVVNNGYDAPIADIGF